MAVTKNNKSYDSGDVTINMLGIPDIYAEGIDYSVKEGFQLNHGMSRKPRSWSRGKEEYTGSIDLFMDDVAIIQKVLPAGKRLTDLAPFNIIVQYNPSTEGSLLPMVTDRILAKFTSTGRKVAGEDMGLKQNYELGILSIDENIA